MKRKEPLQYLSGLVNLLNHPHFTPLNANRLGMRPAICCTANIFSVEILDVYHNRKKNHLVSLQFFVQFRPGGRLKILGVLITLAARYSWDLELLGVLNTTFFLISKNIGSAIAPPATKIPTTLRVGLRRY